MPWHQRRQRREDHADHRWYGRKSTCSWYWRSSRQVNGTQPLWGASQKATRIMNLRRLRPTWQINPGYPARSRPIPSWLPWVKKIHEEKCKTCHEDGGRVQEDDAPRLAGQWPDYSLHYLKDCHKKGRRCAPRKMGKRVMNLSQEELKAMAHYYASEK